MNKVESTGISKGCNKCPPFAMIDLGDEMEVIGGVGWHVLNFYYKSETLIGTLNGVGSEVIPSVDAATEVEYLEGRIV